ncbi:MAG: SRPBCC family protein [Novosphingobium sp.]|nr:MAG: SRPBCC family protein [Novosphingobium sp.]
MIETEQTVTIREEITKVWDFARDIRGWASLMPGMQDCEVIDDDNSRWTLKVGVGGLVRTVRVQVKVDQWDGPERVAFTYKLEGDPVQGGGSYLATATGPGETEVKLTVQVQGSGPMAPMWEAMGKPLLPQLAKGFAGQLRDTIEAQAQPAGAASAEPVAEKGFLAWLRQLWRSLFGAKS